MYEQALLLPIYPGWRLSGDLHQPPGDCEDSPAGGRRDHHWTSSQRAQCGPWPGLLRPLQGNVSLNAPQSSLTLPNEGCMSSSANSIFFPLFGIYALLPSTASYICLFFVCLSRVLKHVSWETSPSQPSISRRMPTLSRRWLMSKAGWVLCSFSLLERLQVISDYDLSWLLLLTVYL